MRFAAICSNQPHRVAIEAGEYRPAEPPPLKADHPVGEIAALLQEREARLNRWPVDSRRRRRNKPSKGGSDFVRSATVCARRHPHEFAKRGKGKNNRFGTLQRSEERRVGKECRSR